jgi:hypothetical protein
VGEEKRVRDAAMIENRFFPELHGNFGFGCMRLPMKDGSVDLEQFARMPV